MDHLHPWVGRVQLVAYGQEVQVGQTDEADLQLAGELLVHAAREVEVPAHDDVDIVRGGDGGVETDGFGSLVHERVPPLAEALFGERVHCGGLVGRRVHGGGVACQDGHEAGENQEEEEVVNGVFHVDQMTRPIK